MLGSNGIIRRQASDVGSVTVGPTISREIGTTRSHFEARGAVAAMWSFARKPAQNVFDGA